MNADADKAQQDKDNAHTPFVVGIGSSAGGIEALISMVSALPDDLNASLVIAQHLSPSHKSQMADILSRETDFPVKEVRSGTLVEKQTVYVGPPGHHVLYKNGHLHLDKEPAELAPKPAVNLLFESLADELGDHAIGVVLSGTGNDGSRGLKAIKSVGGFALVQDPRSSKYDGMPQSALETVDVDKIIEPEDVGQEIAHITQNFGRSFFPPSEEARAEMMSALYGKIRDATKIDFSFYKQSTLLRRVNRRLIATQKHSLTDYLTYLDEHPEEVTALAKELLISVTDFFRDKHAFKAIRGYIGDIVDRKASTDSVRVWVAGCATGEEAYSIAILFLEEIEAQGKDCKLQMFATDIDDHALGLARKGAYSTHAVNSMDQALVEKYFNFANDSYHPTKQLRDSITFSRQDITRDPPFLHLDMVSFRNVLIYFNNDLQNRVLSLFRYSLVDDGILFLGKSESTGIKEDMFVPLDRRCRIFKVTENSKRPAIPKVLKNSLPSPRVKESSGNSYERIFTSAVMEQFGPSILINARFSVLHSHGRLKPFINFPAGVPELNLSKLITQEFSAELISTMNKAKRSGEITFSRVRKIEGDYNRPWRLVIIPLEKREAEHYLVNFREADSDAAVKEETNEYDTENTDVAELITAREQLQTLTEEMAASAEEMQALNEEVQAANEELQANNEELEATNEELQATNEELISVNEESMKKSSELAAVNNELESVYNTLDFPILVFDTDLRLNRTNDAANRRYHLNTGSYNRMVGDLNLPEYFDDIGRRISNTLKNGAKTNIVIKPSTTETYNVFVTPIYNNRNRITGAIAVIIDNSELVLAHERIEKNQEQLLSIMNNSLAVVALKDNSGRYEFVNARFEEIFGLEAKDVLGRTDLQLFEREVATNFREKDLDTMRSLTPQKTIDEFDAGQGRVVLESVRFPIFDAEGTIKSICTQATDITKNRHANEQLKLAGKLFDRVGEAILITDKDETIITSNDAFTEFTGYALTDIIGKRPSILASGQHSDKFYATMRETLQEKGYWQGEMVNRHKDGHEIPMWVTINMVRDAQGEHQNYVATYSDVNEIKGVQKKIEFLATHDELTKLPNRTVLDERLELMVNNAKRSNSLCAVMFIDLDDFKQVNDNLGHNIGDLLLKQVTRRLQSCTRDTDMLARLGGDEFVALIPANELNEIDDAAKRIVGLLAEKFEVHDYELNVSASVGISIYPDDGESSASLLKHADEAMYIAKEHGRNQYQYFTHEMKQQANERVRVENALRKALADNTFEVALQPQIEVLTGTIVGAEALLRSSDEALSGLSAARMIEVAEQTKLIDKIGIMMLEKVIRVAGAANARGEKLPQIAVNISTRQLRSPSFADDVEGLLNAHKLAPSQLKFEITERALLGRVEQVQGTLRELAELGVSLSVDDFALHQSSLIYLRRLQICEIKIDRDFIKKITDDEDSRVLTQAFIKMGTAMGLRVVAEGIENDEQFEILKQADCEVAQGYYFYEPLDPDEFAALVKREQSKSL
ncbi:EAL domain-containing protein [Alteromonas sp. ASW11-19]|uniref:EAL domain-containing protein n=1 Tax=Alteromonas salexigens TaxID=2982530 RepID=A0ABT2VIQ3_9ALTE|nr:EAL domain-containing protein [Alteromonas salexigens]MCU7553030.1 EAL domain-containing protein [Alteromonas salexigens]